MKFLLSFLFILIFPIFINAQVFNAGVMLGISGSQVEGDGYGGYNKLGFIAGGFANTEFSDKVSTQLEIYYINKGSQKNPRPDKGDVEAFNLNINYIEIPISFRYHYKKFIFEGGLYASKFLSYSMSDQFGERDTGNYPFKSFDFGGFFGINYKINDNFIFNLRSKNSLIPIRDFNNFDQQIGILNKLFNRGWYSLDLNFSVRYQFNKSK
ncbi:PorT family protein [Vicingus serpentipes]|jgi:outer membrane protein with beta-barrel domain|uniref:PorT family protein n=1 Tax=Vicingus serpentipes TaxID=1926625 RepID=A0A5C6RXW0_9FLAO|nr:porin family protein [Vicingus serpentipes]TXB67208.1 PorT family protein [Vicingus serpentipes]